MGLRRRWRAVQRVALGYGGARLPARLRLPQQHGLLADTTVARPDLRRVLAARCAAAESAVRPAMLVSGLRAHRRWAPDLEAARRARKAGKSVGTLRRPVLLHVPGLPRARAARGVPRHVDHRLAAGGGADR